MASQVFFAPFEGETSEQDICGRTKAIFEASGLGSAVPEGGFTAVKTHFGERGNCSYVPPAVVKTVVDAVKACGGEACLVETSTLYRGQRSNSIDHFNLAVEHGFGPERMGCPLLFVDGLRGHLHMEERVDLKHFETVAVAGDFTHIPAAMIVTHVTGHVLAGFGGAIKNVAMGLASRAGKLRQHSAGRPHVEEAKCINCGTCERWCPQDAIEMEDVATIHYDRCIGCGECVAVCPVGAVGFSWDEPPEVFNEKLAEYAYGILRHRLASTGFISFLHRVTLDCNCIGEDSEVICPDVGIVAGRDPVAVDQASADLINEAHGSDLFEERWPDKNYVAQFAHAESIGLGSREYELVRV